MKGRRETRRTSSTHKEGGDQIVEKTGGRKPKSSGFDDASSVASSTRTRTLRSTRAANSRESSQEVSPAKRKRGRPKKETIKPKTKYFQDPSSDEYEPEEPEDSEKMSKDVKEKGKESANVTSKYFNNNNSEPSSNRASRRSSRVSSFASSAASSALSSLISVRNEKKEIQFKRGLNENLKNILNGNSNDLVNGHESEEEEESDDEYERAIYFGTSGKMKRSTIAAKKTDTASKTTAMPISSVSNFHGYTKQVSLLRSLIRSALEQVESNTVLVVGSSGSGKSALVDHCLNLEDALSKSLIIRLHGFFETDESLAFKSINQQLEDLSTPSNTIPELMELLIQDDTEQKKSFILLLDKFDVFCRKNQTLLYNLFDITRKCKHILVIGSTTRIDAPELLEKRVKSRMNQIMIHLASPFQNVDEYISFAKNLVISNYGMDSLPEDWITPLKQLHSQTGSIRELNKFILQHNFSSTLPQISLPPSQSSQSQEKSAAAKLDITSGYLSSLSYLELSVLVLVFKSCKARDVDTITTATVIKLASSLPSQMVHDRSMLFKVINNLIDYGFVYLVTQITNRSISHMNERTQLGLNIDEKSLKETLSNIQNSIPSNLKNLLVL